MKKIITKINEKHIDQNGILHIKVIEGANIDLGTLMEDHKADAILTQGKKTLALFDARNFFTITPEAYNYLRKGILDKTRIATAVVTGQLGVKILVNFLTRLKKNSTPLKLFTNEEEAIHWLLRCKKKYEESR